MKKKLVFIIAGVVVLVGLIVGAVFLFKPAQVPRDDEGYNAAISEVCAYYRVSIVNYDTGVNLYKLKVDPTTWSTHDSFSRESFCRNCQKAFDKMMHKYGITPSSESVDLTIYKDNTLVASVIDGVIDISHNSTNEFIDNLTEDIIGSTQDFVDDYMDMIDDLEKDLKKKFGY